MYLKPTKVRCIKVKAGRAWIFYAGHQTAYLSESNLHYKNDAHVIMYLDEMRPRENRKFEGPVELKVMKARKKDGLLVHRITNGRGMVQPTAQKRLDL